MSRLNYGPRFGSSAVSVTARYDAALDSSTWKGWRPSAPVAGTVDAVLGAAAGNAAQREKRRRQPVKPSRETHEAAMGERIAKAIEILQFGLEELNGAPPGAATINRRAVMDVIERLKYKCGLSQ